MSCPLYVIFEDECPCYPSESAVHTPGVVEVDEVDIDLMNRQRVFPNYHKPTEA